MFIIEDVWVAGSVIQAGLSRCQLNCPGKDLSLYVDTHSKRFESSHTRQIVQIKKLQVIQQVSPGLQEIDMALDFATLIGIGVNYSHSAGLC